MGVFHAILDPVGALIGSVLGSTAEFIHKLLTPLEQITIGLQAKYILEPIMHFLGFEDEDIYKVSVKAVPIFDDDLYTRVQLKQITEYMKKESKDALKYSLGFAETGDTQFNKYYRYGKWYFRDYLPSVQISSTTVKVGEVKEILKNIIGTDVFIEDIGVYVPYDDDWCKWILQEDYDYHVGEDYLILDDKYYGFGGAVYNDSTGKYDVTLAAMTATKTRIIEIVDASVPNTTSIDINLYTVTEYKRVSKTQVEVTSYTRTEYVWNNEVIQTEETTPLVTYLEDSTIEDKTEEELQSSSQSIVDIQKIVVTHRTIVSSVDTAIIISESTSTISDTETVVINGSGVTYKTETMISNVDTPTGWSDLTITIDYHSNIRRYVVKYSSTETGRKYLFIYNTADGTYPVLSNPVSQLYNLECYPIALLRNGFNDISGHSNNGQHGHAKPSYITKTRYEDTKELLGKVGMDIDELIKGYSGNPDIEHIQNVFFLYGVSPSDSHWAVSRALYEMFDYIYDKMPYTGSASGMSAAFREDPYNAAIMWASNPVVYKAENIGRLGTCTHSASEDTIVIKKQVTPTVTKTITLTGCSAFSIIRESLDFDDGGDSLKMNSSDLVIPLPVEVVNRLTLMEKTALLGRSAYLILYAYQHQHLDWYETEAFGNFMQIVSIGVSIAVAVVVTVITWNPGAGTAAGSAMMMNILGSLLRTALIAGALQLALYVINELVEDTNLKIALTIAAMAAAIALGAGLGSGFNLGTIIQLVELPVKAAEMYMNENTLKAANKLSEDVESFQSKYEDITKQYNETIEGFNAGLSTEATVGLAVDATEDYNTSSDRGFMFSPSQFYDMATTACYNYDALYTGYYDACIHRFVRDKKMLGIFNNEGDE